MTAIITSLSKGRLLMSTVQITQEVFTSADTRREAAMYPFAFAILIHHFSTPNCQDIYQI